MVDTNRARIVLNSQIENNTREAVQRIDRLQRELEHAKTHLLKGSRGSVSLSTFGNFTREAAQLDHNIDSIFSLASLGTATGIYDGDDEDLPNLVIETAKKS